MGCIKSKKIYTNEEEDEKDPMIIELKENFRRFDEDGKDTVSVDKIGELYQLCAEQVLEGEDLDRAKRQLDLEGKGAFTWACFKAWFLNGHDKIDTAKKVKKEPEIHPSVLSGLKDEGVAEGTEQYDREMQELVNTGPESQQHPEQQQDSLPAAQIATNEQQQ
eukprot:CAMPEP_0117747562 /NCGR_PEP_ID=MMETSP0947-20121206/8579_1 /TAXON_ID=44440 /ORGANISM="Chattonella subsalsa, Strain CCMP2191" /LENGTH=162 /DNA_ID=CAMNT_0005565027 /DNA_START=195 /DNA_END=683 /DNA_ORIENTATION=-